MEGSSKASTSSSEATQPFTTDDINKWSTKDVIQHLQAKFPDDFDAEDFEVLLKRKIRGRAFLKLTEGKLSAIGMEYGPASIIAGYIEELNSVNRPSQEPFQTFDVVVKPRTKASFPWYTNINETTINDFKEKITKEYPDMEEDVDDDATVTILVNETSTNIANDSHLRWTLNVFAVSGIKKFTVSLKKLSKAFTAFKFSEVCRLFEISDDTDPSMDAFPEFHCDSMTIDENEHDLKHLIEDLKVLRRTTVFEATRSLYVNRFIVAAVCSFDKDVVVRPQKQLRGKHGYGPVDLGLESRHTTYTLGVTEIKNEDIKKGIAQNALQLEACLTVSRKRIRDEVVEDPVILRHAYGIITDAEKWYFLHCINDDKITFRLSKPVSVDWFSDYSNDVKTVLEHILWLLKEMGKAETETGVHWDTDISG